MFLKKLQTFRHNLETFDVLFHLMSWFLVNCPFKMVKPLLHDWWFYLFIYFWKCLFFRTLVIWGHICRRQCDFLQAATGQEVNMKKLQINMGYLTWWSRSCKTFVFGLEETSVSCDSSWSPVHRRALLSQPLPVSCLHGMLFGPWGGNSTAGPDMAFTEEVLNAVLKDRSRC